MDHEDPDEEDTAEAEAIRLLMTIRRLGVTDPRVISAIETVPRDVFVPEAFAQQACVDRALPIDCGQTISQPSLVAQMTHLLALEPQCTVLEVGTGSGYQAAVLSQLARRVYTIERHRHLAAAAERRFKSLDLYTVVTRTGDGIKGWPEAAPFDRIVVTAAAEDIPQALFDQLAPGGIMVMPLGPHDGEQRLCRVTKSQPEARIEDFGPVHFVPLLDGLGQP